jgi:recombination protein RecT
MTSTTLKEVTGGEKPMTPVAQFSNFLDKFKPQLALALPKHMTADRMARLALTQFSSNEKLQQCAPHSIAGAIMNAATLGLEIGVDGQGFLVPYGKTCTFVPGWKGLTDLANRSGRCTVWTGAVFAGDDFDYALGDSPFVRHKPGDETDPRKITHVYAIGRVNGSQWPVIEVWTISKVWKHRDQYNKVGKAHYSFRDPEMYARKVPLLQVLKYMPKSIELAKALAVANAAEEGRGAIIDGDFVTMAEPEPGDRPGEPTYAQLAERMQAAKDADVGSLILDEGRALSLDEQNELAKLFAEKFPE